MVGFTSDLRHLVGHRADNASDMTKQYTKGWLHVCFATAKETMLDHMSGMRQ